MPGLRLRDGAEQECSGYVWGGLGLKPKLPCGVWGVIICSCGGERLMLG